MSKHQCRRARKREWNADVHLRVFSSSGFTAAISL